jgi:hypothetical protein
MVKNVVSFIHSFMILMKSVDFRVLRWVCSTGLHSLVLSLGYFVSDGRQVLSGGH